MVVLALPQLHLALLAIVLEVLCHVLSVVGLGDLVLVLPAVNSHLLAFLLVNSVLPFLLALKSLSFDL